MARPELGRPISLRDSWKTDVSRLRQVGQEKDRYGVPIPGTGVTETLPLPRALFNPGTTEEPAMNGGQPVVTNPTVYWRKSFPDLSPTDRLLIHGRQWQGEGDIAVWTRGTVVTLRGVTDAWSM